MSTPEIVISRDELERLPEYSTSIPTGTTIGKRWRRNCNGVGIDGIGNWVEPEGPPEWMIGEYVPDPRDGYVGIKWAWAVDEEHELHRVDFHAERRARVAPPPPSPRCES